MLDVAPGVPHGHNALKVLQRGENDAANIQEDNFIPPGLPVGQEAAPEG